jgi:hypothetical protein
MTRITRERLQFTGAMATSAGYGISFFCLHHLGATTVPTLAYAGCFVLIAVILAAGVLLLAWRESREGDAE